MVYKHTRRSAVKTFFLSLITLEIYGIVQDFHIRKNVKRLTVAKESKPMSYWLVLLFTPFTLGIVPIVWMCKIAGRVSRESLRRNCHVADLSAVSFFLWQLIPIAGFFIAYSKLFHLLNAICKDGNEQAAALEAKAKEEKK